MSAERVLQAAIVAALKADAAYMALVTGVFDGEAPAGTDYPHTVIGSMTEGLDRTHDLEGFNHTVTIHDWSQYAGRRELQLIREARGTVLQNTILSVSGWGLTKLTYEFGEVVPDRDAELDITLRHQITRYRTYSLENAA